MNYDQILCRRVAEVPPSGIRKFFDVVSEMKGVVSLGVGEPDFNTPWGYSDAAIYSLRKGHTHYTSNWGLLELRKAIAEYMEMRFQVEYDPKKQILVTVGASEGIDIALRALVEPGDEVLVPDPSYVSYAPGVTFAGGVCVPVRTDAEHAFTNHHRPEVHKPVETELDLRARREEGGRALDGGEGAPDRRRRRRDDDLLLQHLARALGAGGGSGSDDGEGEHEQREGAHGQPRFPAPARPSRSPRSRSARRRVSRRSCQPAV